MIGAKKMRFDQCVGLCIVSNFWLDSDSHLQIPTATDLETPSAPTLARSNLIRLLSLDLKNQFMPISACTSRSGRSRGSSTARGLEGASHCIRLFIRAGPFLLDAFPRWSGLVFNRLHCVLVSSSLLNSKFSISSAIFELLIIEFPFCVSNEICDDRRQKKCGLISTLVIALFRTSGFTVILIRKFWSQWKPHLLRR